MRSRKRERRQIGDELAALPGEGRRVLAAAVAREADDRRIAAEAVEEAVGREVHPPVEGAGRDPADRPRRDDRLERIVRQRRLVALARLVEHRRFTRETW